MLTLIIVLFAILFSIIALAPLELASSNASELRTMGIYLDESPSVF